MGSIVKEYFDKLADGREVYSYTMSNDKGMKIKVLSYAGAVNEVWVPDAKGETVDITTGFDNIDGYVRSTEYQGQLIGRMANRTDKGHFFLDGKEYQMSINSIDGHLHGGFNGLSTKIWDVVPTENAENGEQWLDLSVFSPDGEENYPGNLTVNVRYILTNNNEFKLIYRAKCDKKTPVNFTNHMYFNLNGYKDGDILGHKIEIKASRYTKINESNVPTGELAPVEGSPFDFRVAREIGRDLDRDMDNQMKFARGIDHNFCFDKPLGAFEKVAELSSDKSGRVVSVYTDQPGMQLYIGNYLEEPIPFKGGVPQRLRQALCMETQAYPNALNNPDFPSVILEAGEEFKRTTVYAFSNK